MVLKTIYLLTCWCLKNVRSETQARPICKNICLTLVKEPPAQSTAMHIRKFPANILVPGINGWLLHTNSFRDLELVQIVLMTIAVPRCSAFTSGVLPVRQMWQNWRVITVWTWTLCVLPGSMTPSYCRSRPSLWPFFKEKQPVRGAFFSSKLYKSLHLFREGPLQIVTLPT